MSLNREYETFEEFRRASRRRFFFLIVGSTLALGGAFSLMSSFFQRGLLVLDSMSVGLVLFGLIIIAGAYLGIFEASRFVSSSGPASSELRDGLLELQSTIREVRSSLAHVAATGTAPPQINIDDQFQTRILERLATESKGALASFIDSEVFKKSAEVSYKEDKKSQLTNELASVITNYAAEMGSWRKNANINLIIGLFCALSGIVVMWQTLLVLPFTADSPANQGAEIHATWNMQDLYRFVARFGLVLIIESVAFFFSNCTAKTVA